jgi:hypothetical protein
VASDRNIADGAAEAVDGSGRLVPQDRGLRQTHDGCELAAPDLQVCRADAGGMDLDPDLRLRRIRHRDLLPLENVGGTITS